MAEAQQSNQQGSDHRTVGEAKRAFVRQLFRENSNITGDEVQKKVREKYDTGLSPNDITAIRKEVTSGGTGQRKGRGRGRGSKNGQRRGGHARAAQRQQEAQERGNEGGSDFDERIKDFARALPEEYKDVSFSRDNGGRVHVKVMRFEENEFDIGGDEEEQPSGRAGQSLH